MVCASFAPNIRESWMDELFEAPRPGFRPLALRDGIGDKPSLCPKASNRLPFAGRPQSLDWLNSREYTILITFDPSKSSFISTTCGRDSKLQRMRRLWVTGETDGNRPGDAK